MIKLYHQKEEQTREGDNLVCSVNLFLIGGG